MSVKTDKGIRLMNIIEIPYCPIYGSSLDGENSQYHSTSFVRIDDLYDILMDDEKLKILVGKLKNKAFW